MAEGWRHLEPLTAGADVVEDGIKRPAFASPPAVASLNVALGGRADEADGVAHVLVSARLEHGQPPPIVLVAPPQWQRAFLVGETAPVELDLIPFGAILQSPEGTQLSGGMA